jgi:hypothetical protein
LYAAGAAMGWTAAEVGRTNLWHLTASMDGWLKAQGVEEKPEPMSLIELDALIARTR